MSITRVTSACAIASALVLLAGCGSSSSSGSGGTTTASSKAPTASPSPSHSPATVVQLKKIVIQPGDLPSTWNAIPATPDSGEDQGGNELTKCLGGKNTDQDKVASANSDNYLLGGAKIAASATSYKSQSDVDSDIALLKSPKLNACTNQVFKEALASSAPDGSNLGTLSVKFTPGPGSTWPSNVSGVGAVTVPIISGNQKLMVYVNFVFLTGPLIEVEVDGESVGTPVPAAALHAAVKAVAARAANGG